MKVHTANKVNDLALNVALAKAIGGQKAQVHVFEGRNGSRVRVLTPTGAWRIVNWKANGWLNKLVRRHLKAEILESTDGFHAKIRGKEAAVADDPRLAVAMAAISVAKPNGFRLAFV